MARVWVVKRLLLFNMIVCVCNNISESQIRDNPSLLDHCATECATCEDLVMELRLELDGVGGSNAQVGKSRDLFELGAHIF